MLANSLWRVKPIFVSHASADAELVDKFVDTVLRNGCNLDPDDIFYTSGEDTGIPSGADLIATVRSEVGEATLVLALISPTYQTRPVCLAELGAAWGRAGTLIPLLFPGFGRERLEGVLDGMAIRPLDESAALNEVHDRVVAASGRAVKAATWSRHKQAWLSGLPNLLKSVSVPTVVSPTEVVDLRRDLSGAREALDEVEQEKAQLQRELDAVSKLKDASEVATARLPDDDEQRFRALTKAVVGALRPRDAVVRDAIWATRFGSGLKRPPAWDDDGRSDAIDTNLEAGFLYEGDEGTIYANTDARPIELAVERIDALEAFLTNECSEGFAIWFKEEFDFDPGLRKKHVWDQLF